MTRIETAADQVRQACGLPALLDAACEAFQEILTVLRVREDDTRRWLIPFVMAATSAAEGRDAIIFAPSLPPTRQHQLPVNGTTLGHEPDQLAEEVSALASALADSLAPAAAATTELRDRDACRCAAAHARDIHRMLTG